LNSYVLRTAQEDLEMVQSFLSFLDDELVIIAEDMKGNAAGLLICLPVVYQTLKGGQKIQCSFQQRICATGEEILNA
jgi:hypothetical protein